MDDYGFRNRKDYYDRSVEFSRTDLWILGTLLSLFAAVMVSGLPEFSRSGDVVLPVVATVAIVGGAVASFWGAIQWGKPSYEALEAAEANKVSLLDRAYEIDLFHNKSRAA